MTILQAIKTFCEVEETTIYDDQLLIIANGRVSQLSMIGVPITAIDDTTDFTDFPDIKLEHTQLIQEYLNLSVIRLFDKNIQDANTTTQSWIDRHTSGILQSLKCIYDRGAS